MKKDTERKGRGHLRSTQKILGRFFFYTETTPWATPMPIAFSSQPEKVGSEQALSSCSLFVRQGDLSSCWSSSNKNTCLHATLGRKGRAVLTPLFIRQDMSLCQSLPHKNYHYTALQQTSPVLMPLLVTQDLSSHCLHQTKGFAFMLVFIRHLQAGLHQTRFHAALCKAAMFLHQTRRLLFVINGDSPKMLTPATFLIANGFSTPSTSIFP